jgi:DNA-binding response OmpR family regulator
MSIFSNTSPNLEPPLSGDRLRRPSILWIHQDAYSDNVGDLSHPQIELYRQMRQQGIEVRWNTLAEITVPLLKGVDMVLIDAFDDFDSIVQMAAIRVRIKSRVPLVLLTQDYSSEQLVLALRSGVDAILSCQTPSDLLMARCNALLRRWRASSSARQKS